MFIDLERDCMGSTCKYLGVFVQHDRRGRDGARCRTRSSRAKPHLKAFLNTNVGEGLVNGSTAIAMDWDYDVALLQQKNDKIKWVLPEEGMHAYLEGFTAVQDTDKIDVIQAFLNFLAEPKQYADFVNTTGTAYMMPSATPLIKKTISQNPILVPTPEVLARPSSTTISAPRAATLWTQTWKRSEAA